MMLRATGFQMMILKSLEPLASVPSFSILRQLTWPVWPAGNTVSTDVVRFQYDIVLSWFPENT